MHDINSSKNNSRIINRKNKTYEGDAKPFPKRGMWPFTAPALRVGGEGKKKTTQNKTKNQTCIHNATAHVKSASSEWGARLLSCTFLILVWGLIPHLGLGFQQATETDATSFWLTVTAAQLLGVTMFSNSPVAEAAILARVFWLCTAELIPEKHKGKHHKILLQH